MTTDLFLTLNRELADVLAMYGEDMGFGGPATMPDKLAAALQAVSDRLDKAEEEEADPFEIKRLSLRAGDLIVIRSPDRLSPSAKDHIKRGIPDALAAAGLPKTPVLVLDDGLDLQVIGREEVELRCVERSQEPLTFTREEVEAGEPLLRAKPGEVERLAACDLTGPELTAEIERLEAERLEAPARADVREKLSEEIDHLRAERNARRLLAAAGNGLGEYEHSEETCPGHVASAGSSKVCGRCGVHIDSLRPLEEGE